MTTLTVSPGASPFPYAALGAAAYVCIPIDFNDEVQTFELSDAESKISTEVNAVEKLTRHAKLFGDEIKVASTHTILSLSDLVTAETLAMFKLAHSLSTTAAFTDVVAALNSLDDHLTYKTFLVRRSISAADFVMWGAMKCT